MSPLTALFRRPGFHQERPQDGHASLHGVRRQEHFRHEQDAVAEILADDLHAGHQRLGEDIVRGPAAIQEEPRSLLDLLLHAVIEVVLHLRDEVLVGEFCQDDVVVRHDGFSSSGQAA
jgi:hypothetical protein